MNKNIKDQKNSSNFKVGIAIREINSEVDMTYQKSQKSTRDRMLPQPISMYMHDVNFTLSCASVLQDVHVSRKKLFIPMNHFHYDKNNKNKIFFYWNLFSSGITNFCLTSRPNELSVIFKFRHCPEVLVPYPDPCMADNNKNFLVSKPSTKLKNKNYNHPLN